jgi:hypothetical protein
MPDIYTYPDYNFDRNRPRLLVKHCDWNNELIEKIVNSLGEKQYDIYLHNDNIKDIQWAEGVRANSKLVVDWRYFKHRDPVEWLKEIDNEF